MGAGLMEYDELAYHGATPWHGQGHPLKGLVTSEEMRQASNLMWEPELHPVYLQHIGLGDEHPQFIEAKHHRAVVRSDHRDVVLGVVSDNYQIIENAEMFDSVEEAQDFYSDDGGSNDSGGGGSYIATAATNALGKEGLDMFEGWRDYMHTAHPTFTTSYGRYRVTAPKIVSAIDNKTNSKELYQDIWNEYLKPIFNLIKVDMDDPKALSDYKVMVKELTNKHLKGDK